jgi:hypothetical protein
MRNMLRKCMHTSHMAPTARAPTSQNSPHACTHVSEQFAYGIAGQPRLTPAGQEYSSVSAQTGSTQRTPEEILALTAEPAFFQPCPSCSQYRVGRDVQLTFFNLAQGKACCSVCKGSQGPAEAVLQVRRSSYHDVVRVNEVTKIFDISAIQPYWINNDRVVFLRPRPQPRPPRGCSFPAACSICNRQLMDAHASFCSLQCKLRGAFSLSPEAPAAAPAPHRKEACSTPAEAKQEKMLPQWGKLRKRSPPECSTSDGAKAVHVDVHTHAGYYSEDEEAEGLSPAGPADKFQGFVTVVLSGSSRKRKHTPYRSPLE